MKKFKTEKLLWSPSCLGSYEGDVTGRRCKGEFMTRFFIDDREIAPPLNASSLDDVLRHVEDVYLPPDSVVRQIQIDGLPLIPNDSSENWSALFDRIEARDKVEIFTGTVEEIARCSIAEALTYLDRIETAILSLAGSFQISPGPQPFENLRQLCEGFYWLNVLLDKLKTNFEIDLDNLLIKEIPAPEYHRKFISILKQLIDSQEKGDFVLIADLLEYEILPLVPVWKEMFSLILGKIG
jgi:hypothetical protein